ncbi:hypothetical protein CAPTEDRAFT_142033, partial [Capitella teleta]
GSDETEVIDVLLKHNNAQRLEIKKHYNRASNGKKKISCGYLRNACLGLVASPHVYLAREIRKAVKGLGTDEGALIEILLTRNNGEIRHLKTAYEEEFQRCLQEDVEDDTSGAFRRLLFAQLAASRNETSEIDLDLAHKDAAEIYNAGEGQRGTDDTAINAILCLRSYSQLLAMFDKFQEIAGKDTAASIDKAVSGDLRDGYLAIIKFVRNSAEFFAEQLNLSMKGSGTDERKLSRILISRSEIDLINITEAFQELYDKKLCDEIDKETSGNFKQLLLGLLKPN